MGAWNYGALDNDPAGDVLYRWNERVEKNGLTPETATDLFFKDWGDAIRYGDSITNMEIVALLAVHLNNSLPVPKKLKRAAEDAINRELVPSMLETWTDAAKRKEVLLSLMHEIGGKVTPPKKVLFFNDPALCYKNTSVAYDALLELVEKAKKGKPLDFPPFLKTLNRLMTYNVWEKDYKIYEQAQRERLMMLALYLGLEVKMDAGALKKLMDRCTQWPNSTNVDH